MCVCVCVCVIYIQLNIITIYNLNSIYSIYCLKCNYVSFNVSDDIERKQNNDWMLETGYMTK